MKEIDEILLKVSAGQIVLDADLNIDDEVAILIKGNIVKTEHKSNNDGTVNRVHTVKGYLASVVYKDSDGEVVTQNEMD